LARRLAISINGIAATPTTVTTTASSIASINVNSDFPLRVYLAMLST
jgi:hypothetical protein